MSPKYLLIGCLAAALLTGCSNSRFSDYGYPTEPSPDALAMAAILKGLPPIPRSDFKSEGLKLQALLQSGTITKEDFTRGLLKLLHEKLFNRGELDKQPVLVWAPRMEAMRGSGTNYVIANFTIRADGHVGDVEMKATNSPGFADTMLRNLAGRVYVPGIKMGQKVATRLRFAEQVSRTYDNDSSGSIDSNF